MSAIRIKGVATAVPKYVYDQAQVRQVVEGLFSERVDNLDRLLRVFDHLHIDRRHFARDPQWYAADHGFAQLNQLFTEAATELSCEAASTVMAQAGVSAAEVAGVVVVTTTGMMTPSLDAVLIQELDLPLTSRRLPIVGLGCAGGVAGLARAAELSSTCSGAPVLFVAVEICSATFQKNDISKSNLIGTSIFGDGAAALIVEGGSEGPEIVGSFHQLFPNTYDIMGWDIIDSGMKVRFSRDIPSFVRHNVPKVIADSCRQWGISPDEILSYITHPGGAKVLEAFADVIGKPKEALASAYKVLRNYGNMSSASILFVLEDMLRNTRLETGYALMSALGPGFSSDQLLLKIS